MVAILGISAFYHDSAAALIVDGEIVEAVQEERFTRKKHDQSFPTNSINYLLKDNRLSCVDYVAFYDKPFLKFERLLETYIANAPRGFNSFRVAIPVWLRDKLFQKKLILNDLNQIDKSFQSDKLLFSEHHFSHASSAFYPSPFEEAVTLTIDGVGEWATTTIAIGKSNKLDIIRELHFPHSLGLLYSAFTYYTGFKVNGGEYKLMGLAPYGEPKYIDLILDNLIDLKEDGSFRINQKYFNYATGLTMTNDHFSKLFGQNVRKPDFDDITQFHMDVAASIQAVTEIVILKIIRNLASEFDIPNLCMAGGVALNCVANGKILEDKSFKNLWIQPAAGDAGGAIGAALSTYYKELNNSRKIIAEDSMKGSYLGPEFSDDEIEKSLTNCGAVFNSNSVDEILKITATAIDNGKAIGWFQGKMEFGPRALGARSIIADARSDTMQKNLNLKVKFRENFRPFAPSVLREDVDKWFELDNDSPYMLIVSLVKEKLCRKPTKKETGLFGIDQLNIKRSKIPAVTHVDYSARVQTVHKETNPIYYKLIHKFKEITGCPVIINTSFNVRGEPIVLTPEDAFKCFMGTELDMLVIGNFILYKEQQDKTKLESYKDKYELD
jgi:carbamoyltransferase|tara:strand:- start:2017 stop:3846 length:1830 start_codon:yes stop_codon:yes gene_type:complete